MIQVTRERFEELVQIAIARLPRRFRKYIEDVSVVILDYPGEEAGGFRGPYLLGLYVGIPHTRRSVFQPIEWPKTIYLYQRNIERICDTEEELRQQIRDTVLHEIGHHFGMTEEQLQAIEQERRGE